MRLLNKLFKAKLYPIGTIRTQGGIKKKKVAKGKWVPAATGKKKAKQGTTQHTDNVKGLTLESRIQKYVDRITDKYKVPHIPIRFIPEPSGNEAEGWYSTWKYRGSKINHAKYIGIPAWKYIRDDPEEWIYIAAHEIAHHVLNSKKNSLRHTKEHAKLSKEIEDLFWRSEVDKKVKQMLKVKKALKDLESNPFMKHIELVNINNIWFRKMGGKWNRFYWFPKNLEKAYKLQGRTTFQDLPISIENRKGSVRHWYDPMKNEHGTTKMKYPYGYIRLTEGADGEHVDVYIGDDKTSRKVYIVRQQNPKTGAYDEDKVMLGFNNPKEAKEAYLMHYNDPRFFGSMDTFDMDTFKDHIKRKKGKVSREGRLNKAYYSGEDLKHKNMRWVTIRGNHVLVQGLADGGYVVVGGAGGALNHLRLDKLLSKEEYAEKETERGKRAKQVFNELTPEEKKEQLEQRKKVVEAKRGLRSSYTEKVATILGTSVEDLKAKISLKDMDDIERRARKEVESKKKRPISEVDKGDIEKQKQKEIEKEVKKKIKSAEQSAVDVLSKDFLGDDLDPNGKVNVKKLLDTKKAMEILKAKKAFNKELKTLGKERAEYTTRLKEGDVFAGNSHSLDEDILKQVREDIETQKNVKLYDKLNAQALTIQKHIDTGAVNALNGILSEVYGTGALFNSDVVKNLGIEALARTISVKLQLDGRGEVVRKALIDYAKQYREKVVDQATKEFDNRMDKADALRQMATDSDDGAALLSKASANGHALKQIVQGQKVLGTAVGSLRGVAHLINALEEAPQDKVVVDAGKNLLEARQKARAAGLPRGSYSIKTYPSGRGKRLVIEVPRSTVTSFFTTNQANRRQEKLNDLIKEHKENTGYIPPGIKQSIKLDPAQEAGLRFFQSSKRVLLDFEAGLGKTAVAYAGAMEAIHNGGAKKVLVVTPAKLRTQMYSERKVFLDDENQKLVQAPTTDKAKRLANYEKDGITIIGHDQLRTDADAIRNARYDMVVIDEIHEMTSKGSASGRYKGMMKLKDIPMKIGMSGTNIKNDKSEVYKKINFIDPDHTLGSLSDFNKRYKGLNQGTGIFSDSSNDAFRKDISKWVYTQKNHLPVHNDIETLRVNLSKKQRNMYAQSEDVYRKEKANKKIGAAARRDARNYRIIQNTDSQDNAKISKIVNIMRTKHPEEKAVIHVTGLSAMNTAKKRLEQEFGKGAVGLIHGSSRAGEVQKIKQAFNDPGNPLKFIVGTKSLEAGHNLQGGGTVTFQLDLPDTYASFDQRNKRIYRKGQNKDVKTYVLSGHNPYDMRREDILDTKKREMGLMGNPREIESIDESGFLALMRKYETGGSDAVKESAKSA